MEDDGSGKDAALVSEGRERAFEGVKSSEQRFFGGGVASKFSLARMLEGSRQTPPAICSRNSSRNDVPLRQTKILASSRPLPVRREPGQTSFRSWSNQLGKEDMFNGLSSFRKRNSERNCECVCWRGNCLPVVLPCADRGAAASQPARLHRRDRANERSEVK